MSARLSKHAVAVVRLLVSGQTPKQIAGALSISVKTVEFHSLKARRIIGQESIAGLTRWAIQTGLLPLWPERRIGP